jgi:Ulp1 family protease
MQVINDYLTFLAKNVSITSFSTYFLPSLLAKGYQGVAKYAKVTIICSSKI